MIRNRIVAFCVAIFSVALVSADGQGVTLSGRLQTEMLIPQVDTAIGTEKSYDFPVLSNTFMDLTLSSQYVTAGARLELLNNPLPGFETEYRGAGIPNFYVSGGYKWFHATLGDFYDQFGSGLILRTYEDRPLGIDNALRGARVVLSPYKGIQFKALGGMQRKYFNFNSDNGFGFNYKEGAVMGADLELSIEEWLPKMLENNYRLMVGASYVSKYEPEDDLYIVQDGQLNKLNQPKFVGAADFRLNFIKGGWNVLAEYAYKANDPSFDNNYIFKPGSVVLLSGSYSQRGMSFIVQAKRSENMSFRSTRSQDGAAGYINHLPAFSMTHTYALAAMYPYATQTDGEWAFSGEARYAFKRKTPMGGKYGTSFRLSGTYIVGLPEAPKSFDQGMGTDGYKPNFFAFGDETNYLDVNFEFTKKLHKTFAMTAMYMYQKYNQTVIEGKPGDGKTDIVNSHIGIVELKYKPSKNIGMRAELQYLHTRADKGQWAYALYELSLFRKIMLEVSDMYNFGGEHYYKVAATYTEGAHRLQLAYGRTRAGYNCSGGVCRFVPASKGLAISYNVNF